MRWSVAWACALAVMGCEEPASRDFDFAENPCGLDRPTKLTDSILVGRPEDYQGGTATILTWSPSDVARRGLRDAVVAERIDLCGAAEREPVAIPLVRAGTGGYRCGSLGLHWTDDLANPPVELRRSIGDCRGVVVTEQGLFLAEDGALLRYRTPSDAPEAVVTDADTEVFRGQVYSETVGRPLAVHGDDLFYLATGGAVRSVDLQSGLRSLLADGATGLYGHADKPFVVWVEQVGSAANSTVYFPAEQQAVRIPGFLDSMALYDDWITTRGENMVGMYAPATNELRTHTAQGGTRVVRIDDGWAYLQDGVSTGELGNTIVAYDLATGDAEALVTHDDFLSTWPNPYGDGVITLAHDEDDGSGRLLIVDREGVDEIAGDIQEPLVLMGDGSVLYQGRDPAGNLSVRYRRRSGTERIVAWNAAVWDSPVEHFRGDALFVVGQGEQAGLWRMPAIP